MKWDDPRISVSRCSSKALPRCPRAALGPRALGDRQRLGAPAVSALRHGAGGEFSMGKAMAEGRGKPWENPRKTPGEW